MSLAGLRGLCPDALESSMRLRRGSRFKVQGSRFKVQSDLRVDEKKETWKTLIQILVSILTAIGTTLGVTSCMGYGPIAML